MDRDINKEPSQVPRAFPSISTRNRVIAIVGNGTAVPFGATALDCVPDVVVFGAGSDPKMFFELLRSKGASYVQGLFDGASANGASNIRLEAATKFRASLGEDITDDDVFDYVYGVLHSPDFRSDFEVNLRKEPPRVPFVTNRTAFDAFVAAGTELMDLHIRYDDPEAVELFPLVEEWADGIGPDHPDFDPSRLLVGSSKMKYPKVTDTDSDSETYGKKIADKTRLVYNDYLTLSGIPERAHDYVLGTRSGIDWIIDRWYVKTDKASGIVNDVNQWGLEQGKPRYIIDLIKQVVILSIRTVEIVESLPRLRFDEHGTHVIDAWYATDGGPRR